KEISQPEISGRVIVHLLSTGFEYSATYHANSEFPRYSNARLRRYFGLCETQLET
nr:hypothetical protein [Tanacetum cinerariifolium]